MTHGLGGVGPVARVAMVQRSGVKAAHTVFRAVRVGKCHGDARWLAEDIAGTLAPRAAYYML